MKKKNLRELAFIAKYQNNPRAIAKYLNDALAKGGPIILTKAIGTMVRVQGPTEIARKTGQHRVSLYRMFRGRSSPAFDTAMTVLLALDLRLNIKFSSNKSSARRRWPRKVPRRIST